MKALFTEYVNCVKHVQWFKDMELHVLYHFFYTFQKITFFKTAWTYLDEVYVHKLTYSIHTCTHGGVPHLQTHMHTHADTYSTPTHMHTHSQRRTVNQSANPQKKIYLIPLSNLTADMLCFSIDWMPSRLNDNIFTHLIAQEHHQGYQVPNLTIKSYF